MAGVVGGTASELGGGKFANGAVTGAFVHMFNAEMTKAEIKTWNDAKMRQEQALTTFRSNIARSGTEIKSGLISGLKSANELSVALATISTAEGGWDAIIWDSLATGTEMALVLVGEQGVGVTTINAINGAAIDIMTPDAGVSTNILKEVGKTIIKVAQ